MTTAFVSYSTQDGGFVEQLVKDLQANEINLWYDKLEMSPGDSLTRRIGAAIQKSDFFIVILSSRSVSSEWVQRELGVALHDEFRTKRIKVVPVLFEKCKIPAFLLDKVYADFTSSYQSGLEALVAAFGKRGPKQSIETSVPNVPQNRIIWANVFSGNIYKGNVVKDGIRKS